MKKNRKTKKGVASFYIVVFSTLILMVVAASFAAVIISEVTRTSNDDLSQSAYDSALAGIEDAKVAFSDYQRCVEAEKGEGSVTPDGLVTCEEIIYWMNHPDCYMVGHILGRIPEDEDAEVPLGIMTETNTAGSGGETSVLNQAYTCVVINKNLPDYKSTITAGRQTRMVRVKLTKEEAKALDYIKLSWYTLKPNAANPVYSDTRQVENGFYTGLFKAKSETPVIAPPTVELQMVQTAESFTVDEIVGRTLNGRTDRATLYLVPNKDKTSNKTVTANQVANTNNPEEVNWPFLVSCDPADEKNNGGYVCDGIKIELPEPINGDRNDGTFMLAISLPYRQPETDFSVEFYCNTRSGGRDKCGDLEGTVDGDNNKQMVLHDAQIDIDSTGRANDLFRRVEVRLETQDISFPYPNYALQVLNEDKNNEFSLIKNMIVTCEASLYALSSGSFGSHQCGN